MKILIFEKLEEAHACNEAIFNEITKDSEHIISEGPEIIPKNAATLEDDFEAQRTTGWSKVEMLPDGKYYIADPERFEIVLKQFSFQKSTL